MEKLFEIGFRHRDTGKVVAILNYGMTEEKAREGARESALSILATAPEMIRRHSRHRIEAIEHGEIVYATQLFEYIVQGYPVKDYAAGGWVWASKDELQTVTFCALKGVDPVDEVRKHCPLRLRVTHIQKIDLFERN